MNNIKEINGVPCVEANVRMLVTEDLGVIMSGVGPYDSDMVLISELPELLRGHDRPHNHLYITTDEEIETGAPRWMMEIEGIQKGTIQLRKDAPIAGVWKLIVATTDPKLTIESSAIKMNPQLAKREGWEHYRLSQISQSFIEEYCKVGGIKKVMIEVYKSYLYESDKLESNSNFIWKHKLNDNNEIIIHTPEEKMYSGEEVRNLMLKACKYGCATGSKAGMRVARGGEINLPDYNEWVTKNYRL